MIVDGKQKLVKLKGPNHNHGVIEKRRQIGELQSEREKYGYFNKKDK